MKFVASFPRAFNNSCGLCKLQESQAARPLVEAIMFPAKTVMDLVSQCLERDKSLCLNYSESCDGFVLCFKRERNDASYT